MTRRPRRILEQYLKRRDLQRYSRFLAESSNGVPMLHLGCGENYLEGYINIDLPPSKQTVMHSKPDLYADLKEIRFPPKSIALIRSHHVFEHFDRPVALAMLIEWYGWLKTNGILIIETPDFEKAARRVLSAQTANDERFATLRHIFGSHEASWAYHLDGWFKSKFIHSLERLGYQEIETLQYTDRMLDNILVKARKRSPMLDVSQQLERADDLLAESLVSAKYEQPLLRVWKSKLRSQIFGSPQ